MEAKVLLFPFGIELKTYFVFCILFLAIANVDVDVFRTQHYKHAFEHTLDLNYKKYDGIICCSGDGIVHEVVNAIFHRQDKDQFMQKCPVGVIPGGSSNGFAKSICEASEEECSPESCAYIIAKGQTRNVDLMEIETLSEDAKIYAFLSVAWGIIADIDLESEMCRCCGPLRFTVYGAYRWMCLRKVFASLYYLPENSLKSLDSLPALRDPIDENSNDFIRENEEFSYFLANNVSHIGETIHSAPRAKIDDGMCDLLKLKKKTGKYNLLMQLFNQDAGDYFDKNGEIKPNSGLEYIKTNFWRLIPKNNLEENDDSTVDRNINLYYSIDGERYPIEPIQVKTLKQVFRIFCFTKEKDH